MGNLVFGSGLKFYATQAEVRPPPHPRGSKHRRQQPRKLGWTRNGKTGRQVCDVSESLCGCVLFEDT